MLHHPAPKAVEVPVSLEVSSPVQGQQDVVPPSKTSKSSRVENDKKIKINFPPMVILCLYVKLPKQESF